MSSCPEEAAHAHHRHPRHRRADQFGDRQRLYRFSQMTASVVAIVTDLMRRRQAGGRLRLQLERPLCRAGPAARALHPAPAAADPEALLDDERPDRPGQVLGGDDGATRSRAATASARSRSACSTWRCGIRAKAEGMPLWRLLADRYNGGAGRRRTPGSMPPAATTTRARASRSCRTRCGTISTSAMPASR